MTGTPDGLFTKYFGPEAPAFRRGEEGPPSVRLKSPCIRRLLWHNIGMRTDVPFKRNHNIVYSCKYHVVWCPKYRRPALVDGVDVRLKEIILQTAAELRAEIIELEVMPDHVHLLCEVDPQFGIHRLVRRLKGRLPTLWTNSYFVATVGGAPLTVIKQYIEQQKGR